jgi:hypothetical protein
LPGTEKRASQPGPAARRRAGTGAADRLVIVPIIAATASAWWFQFQAMCATALPVLLAVTVATALESLGLAFAGLAHQARAINDSAVLYRVAMWSVVAIAAAVNYRHGSPAWDRPGLHGLVFAALSVGSVAGWELRERQAHRARTADRLPVRRPRFGCARWLRYPASTGRAFSVAIRDGITDSRSALATAATEEQQRRSRRTVRRGFGRAGRRYIARRLAAAAQRDDSCPEAASSVAKAEPESPVPRLSGRGTAQRIVGTRSADGANTDKPMTKTGQQPEPRSTPPASSSPVATGSDPTEVDISDLLPVARKVAAELPRLSRDSLINGIRARGVSVGGRRRKAIYDTIRQQSAPLSTE